MGKLIIDVGCGTGEWIKANYNKDDTFIGIEADEAPYKIAKEYFKDCDNVTIINLLVSHAVGYVDFFISDTSPISTAELKWIHKSRHSHVANWNKFTRVQSITLNDIVAKYGRPYHVKIDVEGHELKVIMGLTVKIGLISFEWVEEFKEDAILAVKHLKKIGYKQFNRHHADDYTYIPEAYIGFDEMIEELTTELKPERAQGWGMIFCK